mmetsp:Transcript_27852/g.80296  ORF Transcript_27852/g.80296 Transcript_27852/m.80296 type:complete len:110 (+) Transcript_27852:71-400(+)
MVRRSASGFLTVVLCILALCAALHLAALPAFVPASSMSLRASRTSVEEAPVQLDKGAQAAVLAAVFAAPEAAHAANQGYAILQLGWAVFIIGLGPAVLFWIYFNKPEIL